MKRFLILVLLAAAASPAPALGAWTSRAAVPGSHGAVLSRVAVSPDGTVAVGWGAAKVAIRRPGGRWLRVRRVSAVRTTATLPDVAFDARGRLLVVWTQSPARPGRPLTGPYEIRLREWTSRGGWGSARVLGRSGHFSLAQPSLATNARGDAIVWWRGFRREGRHLVEALASRLRVAGHHGFGRECAAAGGGPYRDVALDRGGNAYGVYTTYTGPRNYFVYQPRGRGWRHPVRLPGRPASKPQIAVAGDRTATIAWRRADVDSEGNGIQAGPPAAIMRSAGGGFTFPFDLSATAVTDVGVTSMPGSNFLITWAGTEFVDTAPPGWLDLHYALREEGNAIGGDIAVPGARPGPSAFLPDGDAIVVYGVDNAVRSVLLSQRTSRFGSPETIASRGLWPSLGVSGDRAAVTWLDPSANRLRLALRSP